MIRSWCTRLTLLFALLLPLGAQSPAITSPGASGYLVNTSLTFAGNYGGALSPVWDFGDGSGATGWNATHAYASPGIYTISLSASIPSEGRCLKWGYDDEGTRVCLSYQTIWSPATTTQTVTVVPYPVITAFTSAPATIYRGQSTTLNWSTTGASYLELYLGNVPKNGTGNVTGSTSSVEWPTQTTTYSLVAYNGAGTQSGATTTVTVLPPPTLSSFSASPAAITVGDMATLSWSAQGQTALSMSGIGNVSGSSLVVMPSATTDYTLTASNPAGNAALAARVTVHPQPVISSFSADLLTVAIGQPAVLTPVFSGGTGYLSGVGAVASGQRVSVYPGATTTYTLTVTNPVNRQVSSGITVVAMAPSGITSFVANPAAITEGGAATLSWVTHDQTTLTLSGVGNVSGSACSVSPTATTTYTLTASNAASSASASAMVTVHPKPGIVSFTASSSLLTLGQATVLTPVFTGGTGTISGIGAVTSGQGVTVMLRPTPPEVPAGSLRATAAPPLRSIRPFAVRVPVTGRG